LQKLALLITLEDTCNMQQNQAGHFSHWQPNLFHRSDLSQQGRIKDVWGPWLKFRKGPFLYI